MSDVTVPVSGFVCVFVCTYTYFHLIVDHKDSAFSMLRQREVEFCITLLREKVGAGGSKCLCGI